MHWNEEERDSTAMRTYSSSPLDLLANLPVMPPRWRPYFWGAIWASLFLMAIYWFMPRWGMSPFHVRQDGMDYFPFRTELSSLPLGIDIPATPPDQQIDVNLLGAWPGWRLAHYAADGRNILVLRDSEGQIINVQRAQNDQWLGEMQLKDAHWEWHGGWRVDFASPKIVAGQLYLSPMGEFRLIRHEPNAAGLAYIRNVDKAGQERSEKGIILAPSSGAGPAN
ncbi:hypothetical protein HQ393_12010 [Chitinibacter bivalviorum]|uniref:Uncharacterized protein n=1 Tax=Chitinibacter bivalviorum TaxID=2739434 RepID=A0A7H9BKK0_9NEIS|nr:hypothetical protein [Chitinibacter bivalviorum]QLG88902.1 hypothetical protein HQ393_12010 [Chitinibacter bivalviorum]